MRTLEKGVERIIRIFEIILSLLLICGVAAEGVMLAISLPTIISTGMGQYFQIFLDHALIYIIGLEVALMLIKRDPHLVVDILIFAIARKMIMTMSAGVDFLLGAFAILLLYIVKCYGIKCMPLPKKGLVRMLWRNRTDDDPAPTESGPATGTAGEKGGSRSPADLI